VKAMYLPAWPGLGLREVLAPRAAGPLPFPLRSPDSVRGFAARYLIYHLFRALGFGEGGTVVVPDYHHGNEVRAIRAAGASIVWYRIGRDLLPDLDELDALCRQGARALLAIHYFGRPQPMDEIGRMCRERGILLVEDCALALLSEAGGRPLGSFGDYAVFCLYKTLPVPNGGVLVSNRGALEGLAGLGRERCGLASVAGRSLDLAIERARSRIPIAGRAVGFAKSVAGRALSLARVSRQTVGDSGFDLACADLGASPLTEALLERFDYDEIRRIRRRNWALLRDRLAGRASFLDLPLGEGICPLFFPLLVPEKAAAARALWSRGVGAVEFWNREDRRSDAQTGAEALFLRDHVLELPIHQDISETQIDYMAEQVLRLAPLPAKVGLAVRHAS